MSKKYIHHFMSHNLQTNSINVYSTREVLLRYRRYEHYTKFTSKEPGPRLNIKTVLSMYGDFHVKDKTAVRTSYL